MEQTAESGKMIYDNICRRTEIVMENLRFTKPFSPVLDFGCGNGNQTSSLAHSLKNQGVPVVGYDIDESTINFAKRFSGSPIGTAYTSSKKDIELLSPYENIVSFFVLDLAGPNILTEMKKMLAPNGRLILFFYNIKGKDLTKINFGSSGEKSSIKKIGSLDQAVKLWSRMGTDDYVQELKNNGLDIIKSVNLPDNQGKYSYIVAQNSSITSSPPQSP